MAQKKLLIVLIIKKKMGEIIRAPLSGNIFSIIKGKGDDVKEDDTVIVLEP